MAVSYNIIVVIGRGIFWNLHNYWPKIWYTADYICDFIYLLDMIANSRTGYLEQGILVRDKTRLARHYISSFAFKLDILSILPTDLSYIYLPKRCQSNHVPCAIIVRLNRLLRFHRLAQFFDRTESATNFPFAFRISKLIFYILVIIHWNACIYFAISYAIGFGSDRWVYQPSSMGDLSHLYRPKSGGIVSRELFHEWSERVTSEPQITDNYLESNMIDPSSDANMLNDSLVHQYIFCFYWSTLTLTTIGEVPMPERDEEYLFVVIDFLIGLLIFATIVGNIGSMITNMNAARAEFQHKMDSVKQWMKFRKVNKELEDRIIKWFDYLWDNRQTLDEDAVTAILPDRLKAETAIHVHLETLKRVQLFQDCEPGLLVQLVLKLKLQVFSPGDFICRVGDVGKEMYIVKRGELNVLSEDCQTVYGKLTDGSVFGELSILNISGVKTGNRRTANVRSVGYSDLFALSKQDLWQVLEDYPDAKSMLIDRGKEILRKDGLLIEDRSGSIEFRESLQTVCSTEPSLSCTHNVPIRTPSLFGLTGDASQMDNLQAMANNKFSKSNLRSEQSSNQRQVPQLSANINRASMRQRPSLHVLRERQVALDGEKPSLRKLTRGPRGYLMKKSLSFAVDATILSNSRSIENWNGDKSDRSESKKTTDDDIKVDQTEDGDIGSKHDVSSKKQSETLKQAKYLSEHRWLIENVLSFMGKLDKLCNETKAIQVELNDNIGKLETILIENVADFTMSPKLSDCLVSLTDNSLKQQETTDNTILKPSISLTDDLDGLKNNWDMATDSEEATEKKSEPREDSLREPELKVELHNEKQIDEIVAVNDISSSPQHRIETETSKSEASNE